MNIKDCVRLMIPKKRFMTLARMHGYYPDMSDEQYCRKMYESMTGKHLNLNKPVTFGDKIQWLKIHDRKKAYVDMCDKRTAKQYVAEKIGQEHVLPLLGVWENFDQIDFDSLPDRFVLKCTHDSGGLVICRDKNNLDKESAKKKIETCLSTSYYLRFREWPYKEIKPMIIAEEYIENDPKEGLHDYKVWCFNGRAEYIQYITGRIGKSYEAFYDREWKKQPFRYHNELYDGDISKPKDLNGLLQYAEILSKDIPFARVDFYILPDDTIIFGEITLYPMSGFDVFHPDEINAFIGEKIQLS